MKDQIPNFEGMFTDFVNDLIRKGMIDYMKDQLEVGFPVVVYPYPPGNPMGPMDKSIHSTGEVVSIKGESIEIKLDNPTEISEIHEAVTGDPLEDSIMYFDASDINRKIFVVGVSYPTEIGKYGL